MYGLPPDLDGSSELRASGITCPECAGCLAVRRERGGALFFACRVGHTLSVDDLLTGKEEKIECDLWAIVRGLEELVALLEDLDAYGARHRHATVVDSPQDRIAQARDHARRIREIIGEKQPIDLASGGRA
jgi:two-component system chemotaxis response regulator CheB